MVLVCSEVNQSNIETWKCVFQVSPFFFANDSCFSFERILLIHPKVSLILATDMATHFDFLGKFRVRTSEQLTGRWMKGPGVPWYLYPSCDGWKVYFVASLGNGLGNKEVIYVMSWFFFVLCFFESAALIRWNFHPWFTPETNIP